MVYRGAFAALAGLDDDGNQDVDDDDASPNSLEDRSASAAGTGSSAPSNVPFALAPAANGHHPFDSQPGDHAETPLVSYQHIQPLLQRLAQRQGTTAAALRVYDPFYCTGKAERRLREVGFERRASARPLGRHIWKLSASDVDSMALALVLLQKL